ncbi:hypothetical protein ABIA24_001772 [Sinorhizobium fredii]|uniref:DNA-binding protein n=1 Tax=Rhizobium fredii TaxID=380 RepID=UPI0035129BBA
MKDGTIRMQIRLPADVAEFLEQTSRANLTSRNAEVVRSVRERMQCERLRPQAEGIPPSAEC